MSTPIIRMKAPPRTVIKGKMDVRFPASVSAESPIILDKIGGTFAFSFDMNAVIQSVTFAGFVSGPASAVDGNIPQFDGATGKKLKDGKAAPTGEIVGTTDAQTLTNKTLTAPVINSPTGLVKADVGLSNVDNTSDATKNAATATLTNKTLTAPVINSPTGILKGDVGLGNVDNTSDATKNTAVVALTNKDLTSGTNTFPTLNQNTTGSAAKLTTARNIDGQAFDGSANITVIAPGTHAATSKTTPVDADEFALVDSAASNVLKKLTWANLKAALAAWLVSAGWIREVLTANRTYYVDSVNGSDSNNGLASGSGHAFATIQKAVNSVTMIDLSSFSVTIQLAGSFTETPLLKSYLGAGPVIIIGDETTPSNCTITGTGSEVAIFNSVGVSGRWDIRGVKLTSSVSNQHGIYGSANSVLKWQNVDFGSLNGGYHLNIGDGAVGEATGNYLVSGGGGYHLAAIQGGLVRVAGRTVTVSGTPAFANAFAYASNVSALRVQFSSFSGSATGKRYQVENTSVISTGGGGASYFPGNSAGTADSATYGSYS